MRFSMWSRKGMEVEMSVSPFPSRPNSMVTSVSLVLRSTVAFLMAPSSPPALLEDIPERLDEQAVLPGGSDSDSQGPLDDAVHVTNQHTALQQTFEDLRCPGDLEEDEIRIRPVWHDLIERAEFLRQPL